MSSPRFSSIYSISVGALMILMWTAFIVMGNVPEYQSRPAEIVLHLVAEFLTAATLIAGGVLSLRSVPLGGSIQLAGTGMLVYTLIVSPGYYIQNRGTPMVVMFAVLLALAGVSLLLQLRARALART